MQVLIGITAGEMLNRGEAWEPRAHGQAHTYVDAVARSGAAPIIIPLLADLNQLRHIYELCGAIVFSGGNDVDPALYGAPSSDLTVDVSRRRDEQELQLLRWALDDDKPILGICRGMQLLNVAQGGTLYQDVLSQVPTAMNHKESNAQQSFAYIAHNLRIDHDSALASILGVNEIATNALHHQAVKDLGSHLVASARAEDGIIEALEMPTKTFVIGVQSHPEALEYEVEPRWRHLFAGLTQAAQKANSPQLAQQLASSS